VGVAPGFDAGICGTQHCYDECTYGSTGECDACMEQSCGDLLSIIRGEASYPEGADVGGSCWDIYSCMGECEGDWFDCLDECYWPASLSGRRDYWTVLFLQWDQCAESCRRSESWCAECIHLNVRTDVPQPGCQEPIESSSGCEGLSPEFQVECWAI
jgi:hypothetical protein